MRKLLVGDLDLGGVVLRIKFGTSACACTCAGGANEVHDNLMADQGKATTDTYSFDAWGNMLSSSGTTTNPFKFAGQWAYYTDGNSALMTLGVRYYDPATGRFITQDPIGDGINWYTYAYGDPLFWIDPFGLFGLRDISNFFAGWGDYLSPTFAKAALSPYGGYTFLTNLEMSGFDVTPTRVARRVIGVDDVVNYGSRSYRTGQIAGALNEAGISFGVGAGLAGAKAARIAYIGGTALGVGQTTYNAFTGQLSWRDALTFSPLAGRITGLAWVRLRTPCVQGMRVARCPPALPERPLRALPAPSLGRLNERAGRAFQDAVNEELGIARNTEKIASATRRGRSINVIPDAVSSRMGIADIKNEINISLDQQLQGLLRAARNRRMSFNLIVSPRTKTISKDLQRDIRARGGQHMGIQSYPSFMETSRLRSSKPAYFTSIVRV